MTTILDNLLTDLRAHEGLRLAAYWDKIGKCWTIGYGHTLGVKQGDVCTLDQAESMLRSDVESAAMSLNYHLPWWQKTPPVVQSVLWNMAFNMGIKRLLTFKKALAALQDGNYGVASSEMLDSLWAKQVGRRARQLAARIQELEGKF